MATSKLQDIKGLGVGAVELLEAVGIDSPAQLAGNSSKELYEELTRANEHLGLLSRIPSEKVVAGWVEVAQGMSGSPEELSRQSTRVG